MVEVCKYCQGKKHTQEVVRNEWGVELLTFKPCICSIVERFHARVGSEIYNAPTLQDSPLRDLLKTNLFIEAERSDFLPHLKHALWYGGLDFFFRVLTDTEILDSWLSKTKDNSEVFQGYTSLDDAVGDPTLLVLYIGVLAYPNRAMPGVVLQALKMREHKGLPTWIINSKHQSFSHGHLAWSVEGQAYIDQVFKKIRLNTTNDIAPVHHIEVITTDMKGGSAPAKKQQAQDLSGKKKARYDQY